MFCFSLLYFRYGGFCPQFKYQIGETFGRTTCNLLRNPGVASSGKLVLTDIRPIRPDSASKSKLLARRTQSWGDQKLVEKMVPGYTGKSSCIVICMKAVRHCFGSWIVCILFTFFVYFILCNVDKLLIDFDLILFIFCFYFISQTVCIHIMLLVLSYN